MLSKHPQILPTFALCSLLIMLILGGIVHESLWRLFPQNVAEQDIYSIYREGQRLMAGENPYARTLSGDMRQNQKYATYFPGFYLLAWATQAVGWKNFYSWLTFWRAIFLVFNLGIACLLFYAPYRRHMVMLALLAVPFWLFNRWTLTVTQIAQIDFIPLCLLILSLVLFSRHRTLALLLFGLSLAIKQIAIFLLPLYLIWVWQAEDNGRFPSDNGRFWQVTLAALTIAVIPFLISLPFIAWNGEAFFKSILFSATRNPLLHVGAPSLDVFLGWRGLLARAPLFALFGLVYLFAWGRKNSAYTAVLLVLFIFVNFNPTLFVQYVVWVIPFLPLAASELAGGE